MELNIDQLPEATKGSGTPLLGKKSSSETLHHVGEKARMPMLFLDKKTESDRVVFVAGGRPHFFSVAKERGAFS